MRENQLIYKVKFRNSEFSVAGIFENYDFFDRFQNSFYLRISFTFPASMFTPGA